MIGLADIVRGVPVGVGDILIGPLPEKPPDENGCLLGAGIKPMIGKGIAVLGAEGFRRFR